MSDSVAPIRPPSTWDGLVVVALLGAAMAMLVAMVGVGFWVSSATYPVGQPTQKKGTTF